MKYIIKHEIRGRLRIHVVQGKMTCAEADALFWYLDRQKNITDVKVYERTADAVICYTGERTGLIRLLKSFRYEDVNVPENVIRTSGRASLYSEEKDRGSAPGCGGDWHFCPAAGF